MESNDHSRGSKTHSAGSCGGSTYDEELERPIDGELSDAANDEHWNDTATTLARHFRKAAKPQ